MKAVKSSNEYLDKFLGESASETIRGEALKQALDIRKFEIDLYWRRATYFWAFITAAFAGYVAIQKFDATANDGTSFAFACLGFIFSLGWYFVNRGSKAWQQNWEMHVDLLEDAVMGPLYKTVLWPKEYGLWDLAGPYRFSPSKINQLLSLFVVTIWLSMMLRELASDFGVGFNEICFVSCLAVFTVLFAILLFFCGQTRFDAPSIDGVTREYKWDARETKTAADLPPERTAEDVRSARKGRRGRKRPKFT